MKTIPILFIIFTFCFGKPAKQLDANMQEWVGGIGSTKGINYTVTFVMNKSSDKIIPVKVSLNAADLKFIILKNNKKLNKIKFNKGDTLIFKCSYSENLKLQDNKHQKINKKKLYITFNCLNSKKQKIIEITEFKKLKTLMYP